MVKYLLIIFITSSLFSLVLDSYKRERNILKGSESLVSLIQYVSASLKSCKVFISYSKAILCS